MDDKNREIEKLKNDEFEITEKTKEKLKEEINKINFLLHVSEIEDMYNLMKKDIKDYFEKYKKRIELETEEKYTLKEAEENKYFDNILKEAFKELEILVKIRKKPLFDGEYILFKGNESILISFLMENFRSFDGVEGNFNIHITQKELTELIEVYEIEDDFIDKLEKNDFLIKNKYNGNNLFISFKDSIYTDENEKNFRKLILENYNLKINKNLMSDIREHKRNLKKLKKTTIFLEKTINNSKIEMITILSIFAGLFSYLSINFNLMKELLSNSKAIENVFLIIAVFCIGLIPIIVIFFLIKYLFLLPNACLDNNLDKLPFWKKYFFPLVIVAIPLIFVIAMIFIYIIFWDNYKKYNSNFNELKYEVDIKNKEIQELKNEIADIRIKYEKQDRTKLIEKTSNSSVIILKKF